jgi:anaerobic magnesium-protoporphyrin IX monomethyl ester cyclase
MQILLINPPRHYEIGGSTPAVLENNRGFNPPLGVLFIAAVLEQLGHSVQVIDSQVEEYDYDQVEAEIAKAEYDLLGLTVMTFSLIDSNMVTALAKKHHPDKPIVWGGPHLHIYAIETAKFPNVDYVCTGEGEVAIEQLTEFLSGQREWKDVRGIGHFENDRYEFNGPGESVQDLDSLPFVARHLTPYHKYSSILARGQTVTTLFTSRGCPYKCAFCDRPQLRPNFRARSAESVVEEIENCYEMGIDEFIIYDDTFTVDKKRVHAICDEIIDRGLKIYWDCRTNVNAMDESLIEHMARAGCVGIHYGVEVGTEKIQKVINKNLPLDRVGAIFALTRKHGIKTMAYFILGNPTETREDIEEGFRFLKKIDPDFVHLTSLTPFPATEIYLKGLADGIIKTDYWRELAINPRADFETPHWPENFTREELNALIVRGYRAFYLRPKYILRRLRQIRTFHELIKNVRFGIGLLVMKMRKTSSKEEDLFNFRNPTPLRRESSNILRIA